MNEIGKRMREKREEAGKTCAEVATELGMSLQRYWNLENGNNCRTFEKLPAIAKSLGCRIDDFFPEMDDCKTARACGSDDLDDLDFGGETK